MLSVCAYISTSRKPAKSACRQIINNNNKIMEDACFRDEKATDNQRL